MLRYTEIEKLEQIIKKCDLKKGTKKDMEDFIQNEKKNWIYLKGIPDKRIHMIFKALMIILKSQYDDEQCFIQCLKYRGHVSKDSKTKYCDYIYNGKNKEFYHVFFIDSYKTNDIYRYNFNGECDIIQIPFYFNVFAIQIVKCINGIEKTLKIDIDDDTFTLLKLLLDIMDCSLEHRMELYSVKNQKLNSLFMEFEKNKLI